MQPDAAGQRRCCLFPGGRVRKQRGRRFRLCIITESGYNKEENTIDTTAYSATILPESSDAGQTYVDETLFLGDSNTARMYRMFDFCTYDNAIGSVGMSAKSLATYACVELNNSGSYVTMAKAVAGMQPKRVIIDPDVLDSLPEEAFADGMAEVIKYGCIADRAFFHLLYHCADRAAVMAQIEAVLHTCCAIKAAIVVKDERDTGLRMLLNFGHTLGHAYEKAGNYETYTHGQAVAAGMCRAAELGVRLGMTPGELPLLLKTVVRNFGLPDRIPCTMEDYQSAIGLDKKGSGSKISVILLTELGQAQAVPMEKAQLFQLIDEIEKESL